MRILRRIHLVALTAILSLPLVLRAADTTTNTGGNDTTTNTGSGGCGSGGLCNPLQVNSLQDFLHAILNGVIEIGTIVLIMMLVFVGFKFVVARGNPEEIQSARSALVWTVIGGLILLGATAIQAVITDTVSGITS